MTVMLGMVLSAIDVSLSVGAAHGDEQVGEAAFGTVVDDATLVPDAGLGLPAVAAHHAALPGKDEGQAIPYMGTTNVEPNELSVVCAHR